MFEDLAGQVAVITGGARGLGFSMAQALAKWGAKIALLDVLAGVENSAVTVQHELATESVGVVADVTDDGSVAEAFGEVSRALGSQHSCQRRRYHRLGRQRRCLEGVLAAGNRHQLDRYVPVLSGARAGLHCSWHGGVIVNVSSMSARVVNPRNIKRRITHRRPVWRC